LYFELRPGRNSEKRFFCVLPSWLSLLGWTGIATDWPVLARQLVVRLVGWKDFLNFGFASESNSADPVSRHSGTEQLPLAKRAQLQAM
jgi:hypothetical protein